jgi:hypothetical protein
MAMFMGRIVVVVVSVVGWLGELREDEVAVGVSVGVSVNLPPMPVQDSFAGHG